MSRERSGSETTGHRYEYRVWGRHRKARKLLARLATEEFDERVEDCYLILEDDVAWNAKIRDNTLKLKRLISEDRGFERWSAGEYLTAEDTPAPFDEIFDALRLHRAQDGKKFNLAKAVKRLDPDLGVRAVFVTKHRRRYRIGSIRAEVTDVVMGKGPKALRTLVIEGSDLDELAKLRKTLGLKGEPNIAVHEAINPAI